MVHAIRVQVQFPFSSPDTPDSARNNITLVPPPARLPVRFAHPAEASIAGLLDSHRVRWLYEPTTFPLLMTESGAPLQSFTPDFYLPDHDTYIEMTTMRQSLVTRKNRKFRLLRERYPHLNVRLLYRRDVELITNWYLGSREAGTWAAGSIVVSEDTIARRVEDIAQSVAVSLEAPSPIAIALGTGAVAFAERIARAVTERTRSRVGTELLVVQRGGGPLGSAVEFGLSAPLAPGTPIVLVADVVGTGLTAHSAVCWLRDRGASLSALVALADRRSARLIDLPIAGSVVSAPSAWLGGAGIDGSLLGTLHTVDSAIH